ncbi:DUF948 domain-containing protein [Paenibacillus hexagrammi]|uniref:DUF948 domain-containing protein n=1 Tax=Paenibacillus hexagrammi TaxID=2908839 RepID=A0ABY3SCI9_9BACL|nr:DUF948 domain-containing protein [Paenibacillus sp. YPD9-1]UJF31661.1 DUF948 domain-containing protein [Paenibacillus sp. YPD9-1]
MTWVDISAVCAAAAFVVLVVFAVRALIAARAALLQVSSATAEAQQVVRETAEQSDLLLKQANAVAKDMHHHVQLLQRSLGKVEQAGAAVGEVTASLRLASKVMNQSIHSAERVVQQHQRRVSDVIEWAATGMELWQRWQAHRQTKSDYSGSEPTSHKGVE